MKKAVLALVVALICGVVSPATAAVGFGAIGTQASDSNSLNIPYPASPSAGDLLVVCVANKYPNNGPSTPSGWTLLSNAQASGGAGTNTTNEGNVYATVFIKEATGAETGSLAVSVPSGNSCHGIMLRYTKGAGTWGTAAHGGSDNSAGTSWSVTAGGDPGIQGGDMVIVVSAINDNGYTHTSEALASTGVTYGTMTERYDGSTGTGDDVGMVVADFAVTSGTSSAAPVYTMTANGTSGNSPAGASVILRLREVSGGSNTAAIYYYMMQQQ